MDRRRFAAPAVVVDRVTAVGVATLLLGTGLSGPHPTGTRELLGSALLVAGGLALAASAGLLAVLHDGSAREAVEQARSTLEIAWLIAVLATGEAVRQAERRADEAERTREETARHRADGERLHIARELHDTLTHQISVVKVQSEVAVHVARRPGEYVPEVLLAIQGAVRAELPVNGAP